MLRNDFGNNINIDVALISRVVAAVAQVQTVELKHHFTSRIITGVTVIAVVVTLTSEEEASSTAPIKSRNSSSSNNNNEKASPPRPPALPSHTTTEVAAQMTSQDDTIIRGQNKRLTRNGCAAARV